ncbi:unnamed protein product [Cylindrotheca closterium]|uniref:VASt domain-containing protein n=1 Tax=Cylindrotheca closterium TaxID=2856 RepID=A0AAD2CTF5_9STRA|nr:unnamed protein product [Cylindrotheca closterium]
MPISMVKEQISDNDGVNQHEHQISPVYADDSGQLFAHCQNGEWMEPFWDCHDEPVYNTDEDEKESISNASSSQYFAKQDFRGWQSAYINPMGLTVFLGGLAVVAHPFFWIAGALTALGTVKACLEDENLCTGDWLYSLTDEEQRKALELKDNQNLSREVSEVTYEYGGTAKVLTEKKTLLAIEAGPPIIPEEEETEIEDEDDLKTVNGETVDTAAVNKSLDPRLLKNTPDALNWVHRFYPPLAECAMENVTLVGLSALDFFNVFFADDAPFTFEELQRKRQDKHIVYGQWEQLENVKQASLHPESCRDLSLLMKERLLRFKTKTNSFFGPPYADATKSQRALVASKKLLVLEATTTLKEVPFCERFYVMERWVVTAEKKDDVYHASLSISFEVIFVESCPFESQIVSSSKKTFLEIANTWLSLAQQALKQTEQARSERLEQSKNAKVPSSITTTRKEEDSAIEVKHEGQRLTSIMDDHGVDCGPVGKMSSSRNRRLNTFRHNLSKLSVSKLTKKRTPLSTSPSSLSRPTATLSA